MSAKHAGQSGRPIYLVAANCLRVTGNVQTDATIPENINPNKQLNRAGPGAQLKGNHMSIENHEQRIAELERTVANLNTTVSTLILGFAQSADHQKKFGVSIMQMILAADEKYEGAFELFCNELPVEQVREEFKKILARSLFNRDQLQAMLQQFKNTPDLSAQIPANLTQNDPPQE